jgi:hypothetical protein
MAWVSKDVTDRQLYGLCLRGEEGDESVLGAPSMSFAFDEETADVAVQVATTDSQPQASAESATDPAEPQPPVMEVASQPTRRRASIEDVAKSLRNRATVDNSNFSRTTRPDRAALASARELLRELYQAEYSAAKKPLRPYAALAISGS